MKILWTVKVQLDLLLRKLKANNINIKLITLADTFVLMDNSEQLCFH